MTTASTRRERSKPVAEERVGVIAKPGLVLAVLLGAVILWSAYQGVDHQVYALGFSMGESQASVETWNCYPVSGSYVRPSPASGSSP